MNIKTKVSFGEKCYSNVFKLSYTQRNRQKTSKEMGQRNIKFCQTRGVIFKNLKLNDDRLTLTWSCTRKWGSSHSTPPSLHLQEERASPSQRAPFWSFEDHSNPSPPTTSIFIQLLPVRQDGLWIALSMLNVMLAGKRAEFGRATGATPSGTWTMLVHYF